MRKLIFLFCFFYTSQLLAQKCKTFRIGVQGDTLDCMDQKGRKQGKWVIKTPAAHGEPGFDDEGEYKDDLKEGLWRRYSAMGDFIAVENYRWGMKDGISQYFNIYGLEHDESWRAINPLQPFDTVVVNDVNNPDKFEMKVVKVDPTAQRHGNWHYYEAQSGSLIRTEYYLFDKLQDAAKIKKKKLAEDPNQGMSKPKEVIEFERKIAGKRRVRIRDGSTKY